MTDDLKDAPVGLRVPLDILNIIDSYRESHPLHPSRSALVRQILRDWVESQTPKRRVTLEE